MPYPGDRRRPIRLLGALVVALALAAGCGDGGDAASGSGGDDAAAAEPAARASSDGGGGAAVPVSRPTGDVDPQLAQEGEELFRGRGCVSCHTVGEGRRVGPDLRGVTEKREFGWLYHMVTNPDSMVRNDSIARQLLSEYFTPMSDQNVKPGQFRAIYEYLRSESQG